ncbi:MAG TPA: hypothetical protein VNK46_01105 [Nitrospiraceae bacterium]|jgi:hypothetical protein|nr:hypothetical protein [Nitrospiraceae bacterium]
MSHLTDSVEPRLHDATADGFKPEPTAGPGKQTNGSPLYVPYYLDPRCHEALYEIDVPTGL